MADPWCEMTPVVIRTILTCFWVSMALWGRGHSVRMMEMLVPAQVMLGDRAVLECRFDMEGEELYSVKWYKAGHEFFRYIPGDRDQRITTFSLPGISVDKSHSDASRVTLRNLNLGSTGRYRCEVSAEAPLFNTVSQSKRLQVVALPNGKPRISGGKMLYRLGERVSVNCTSSSGHPAPQLKWFIHGKLADGHLLRHYPLIQHENGLQTAILGLDFEVYRPHLYGPDLSLELQCTSSLMARVEKPGQMGKLQDHVHHAQARHSSRGSLMQAGESQVCVSLSTLLLSLVVLRLTHSNN